MALDKNTLIDEIESALSLEPGPPKASAIRSVSEALGDAIDKYVKTASVNVISVSGVTTGPGISGPGSGTLS